MWQYVFSIIGIFGVLAWIICFVAGYQWIGKDFIEKIDPYHLNFSNIVIGCILWTPSSLFILSCLASLLGGISSYVSCANDNNEDNDSGTGNYNYRTENPFSSMIRGLAVGFAFAVSMHFLSGGFMTATQTPERYLSLTLTASLLSFIVGYDPIFFRKWLKTKALEVSPSGGGKT